MTQWRSEFRPMPIAPQPVLHGPLADLLEWQAMAEGAYSANTLRAQKADGAIFQAFCEPRGEPYLPADPKTIRAFIQDRVEAGKKPATIKRYVATVARVHIAAGLLNPCSSEPVRLGLKKMGRETSARQDQAHPLGWKDIKQFIEKILELDHELEAVPGLRYKVDSNHHIVYLDFEEPTLTVQEIRGIFRKLGLEPRIVGPVPSELNPKDKGLAPSGELAMSYPPKRKPSAMSRPPAATNGIM